MVQIGKPLSTFFLSPFFCIHPINICSPFNGCVNIFEWNSTFKACSCPLQFILPMLVERRSIMLIKKTKKINIKH